MTSGRCEMSSRPVPGAARADWSPSGVVWGGRVGGAGVLGGGLPVSWTGFAGGVGLVGGWTAKSSSACSAPASNVASSTTIRRTQARLTATSMGMDPLPRKLELVALVSRPRCDSGCALGVYGKRALLVYIGRIRQGRLLWNGDGQAKD